MTKEEFLSKVTTASESNETVIKIETMYGNISLPEVVKKIISLSEDSIFFEEDKRLLSKKEILEASKDLHVDFVKKGLIPLIDALDNDFISFSIISKKWCFYNIIEDCIFSEASDIAELL